MKDNEWLSTQCHEQKTKQFIKEILVKIWIRNSWLTKTMKLSDREKLLSLFFFRLYEHFHVILDSYDFANARDWHITIESLWKYTPDTT